MPRSRAASCRLGLELAGIHGGTKIASWKRSIERVISAEQAAGQGHAGQHAQAIALGVREVHLLRPPIQPIVDDLQDFDPERARFAGLKLAAFAQDRDAEMADFAGALLVSQDLPEASLRNVIVGAGMELVQIDVLHAQGPEGGFELPSHTRRERSRRVRFMKEWKWWPNLVAMIQRERSRRER